VELSPGSLLEQFDTDVSKRNQITSSVKGKSGFRSKVGLTLDWFDLEVSSFQEVSPERGNSSVDAVGSGFIIETWISNRGFGVSLRTIKLVGGVAVSSSSDTAFVYWLPRIMSVENRTKVGQIQVVSVLQVAFDVRVNLQLPPQVVWKRELVLVDTTKTQKFEGSGQEAIFGELSCWHQRLQGLESVWGSLTNRFVQQAGVQPEFQSDLDLSKTLLDPCLGVQFATVVFSQSPEDCEKSLSEGSLQSNQ